MINRPILITLAAIAAIVIIGVAVYGNAGNSNPNVKHTDQNNLINNSTNTSSNNTQTTNQGKNMISASEAQNIAKKYIEEPGATAGTPNLVEINGKKTYAVPVIMNGKTVGEIDIDAYTGENVGGAGGVK